WGDGELGAPTTDREWGLGAMGRNLYPCLPCPPCLPCLPSASRSPIPSPYLPESTKPRHKVEWLR
ncbi:hypothetical protein CEN46_14230, partial [Fischerella thermalis CCMEE 5318]